MIIREMLEEDCESLSALAIHVWLNTYATGGVRPKMSQFVLSEFSADTFLGLYKSATLKVALAMIEDHLVGLIVVNNSSLFRGLQRYGFEIQTLYVHNRFQRQGIGGRLLCEIHEKCGPASWLKTWVKIAALLIFTPVTVTKMLAAPSLICWEKNSKTLSFRMLKSRVPQ